MAHDGGHCLRAGGSSASLCIHRNPCEDCEAELVYPCERSAVCEGGAALLSFAARQPPQHRAE